jgi:hypothetical protein
VALTAPRRSIPPTMSPTAASLPIPVIGQWSPYPTVVMVVSAHHRAVGEVGGVGSGPEKRIPTIPSKRVGLGLTVRLRRGADPRLTQQARW